MGGVGEGELLFGVGWDEEREACTIWVSGCCAPPFRSNIRKKVSEWSLERILEQNNNKNKQTNKQTFISTALSEYPERILNA